MEHAQVLFTIGPVEVTSVWVTMLGLTILLGFLSWLTTRKMKTSPGLWQNFVEKMISMLYNFLSGVVGDKLIQRYFIYLGTLFVFILFSNYSGLLPLAGSLPGLAAPTSCLSVTAGLAVCTFCLTHYSGVKSNGLLGYSKHFLKPVAFMLPLMILEEVVRPVSLSLRLYGNIFGEEQVTHEIFNLVPLAVPLVMNALSLLMGLVQAVVFVLLSAVYISGAVEGGH